MDATKEFEKAGQQIGLQIWRVEKIDLKAVPKQQYGSFYTGDAYLLLSTKPDYSYDLHMWLGGASTQDEYGAVAIFAMQLDTFLGGKPVQYREVQENESLTFRSYFKSGITYKKGGMASGFRHVVTNDMDERRLLQVKGRRPPRATEVDMSWKSFNKGDCFIIDLGKVIYHWSGSECNVYERLKAAGIAREIRDSERGGRPKIEMIDEGEEPEAVIEVLGPATEIAPAIRDPTPKELSNRNKASLYMISDAAGCMKSTLVCENCPFDQDMLSCSECYILDNSSDNKIFVWKGPEANKAERKAAMAAADKFANEKHCPKSVQIEVMPGGAETALFRQFFRDWKSRDETSGLGQTHTVGQIASVKQTPFDASSLHSNNTMAAHHCVVDDGSGKVQVWRVEGKKKVEVDPATYGHFYGGDCYIILYSYKLDGRKKDIIYTWQGLKCTNDELGFSAALTVELDDSMGGTPVQVRVTQGQEPAHLMSLFKDKTMIIHLGGTSRVSGQTKAGSMRLFHIRRSSTQATRAVEVEPSAEFLNTNDVFVLKTPQISPLYTWKGVGSTDEEMVAAKHVAKFLGGNATVVDEGKEPVGFWTALGGKKPYQTSVSLQKMLKPPRLFGCSNKTGCLIAEEVPGDFTQADLATDDVMLLDAWDQIFVWVGKDANEVEKTGSGKIAKDYVDSDPSCRRGVPIITIKQGHEPPTFTGWFHAWDPKMWEKDLMQQCQARM